MLRRLLPALPRLSLVPSMGLVSTLLLSMGCSAEGPGEGNVLVVMIDAVRADRLSGNGYDRPTTPNLDALAARGVTFLRHYSHGSATRASLPTLLYSRYFSLPIFPNSAHVPLADPRDLFRRPDDEAVSLPASLAQAGFHTAMISAHPWLKPNSRFAGEFAEVHDLSEQRSDPRYPHPRGEAVIDYALEWLEGRRGGGWLLYLHLMDVHGPRYFGTEAEAMLATEGAPAERWSWADTRFKDEAPNESERPVLDAIYDGSLHYVDRELGRLFDWLDEREVLDGTLIAVTSDHGEMLWQRGRLLSHGGPLYEGLAHIPLILSYPARLPAARIESLSETVDLLPTVLGLLDVPLPEGRSVDGRDLLAEGSEMMAGGRSAYAYSAAGIRDERYRLVLTVPAATALGSGDTVSEVPTSGASLGELYDLLEDPSESSDLWNERPKEVERLMAAYREALERPYRRYLAARTTATPESAFAVAATHFEIPGEQLDESWTHSRHYSAYSLRAVKDAGPLELSFPVPDGIYALLLFGQGTFTLEIEGREPAGVTAGLPSAIDLGRVEISGGRFTAAVEPGEGPLELRFFGFRPVLDGRELADDAERTRQLEALGYVN